MTSVIVGLLIPFNTRRDCKWNLIEIMMSAWWYKNEKLTRAQLKLYVHSYTGCKLATIVMFFFLDCEARM